MARGPGGKLGRSGEDAACRYLESIGFTIEARNFRTRTGEIDIVAKKIGLTAFVEVKARRSNEFGAGEEAVTPSKARRIRGVAQEYLQGMERPGEVRFDVIGIDLDEDGSPLELRHLADAF